MIQSTRIVTWQRLGLVRKVEPGRVVGLVEWPDPLRSPFYGISPLAPSQRLILLMLVVVDPDLHGLLVNFRLYLLEIAFVFDALRRALLLSVWALA